MEACVWDLLDHEQHRRSLDRLNYGGTLRNRDQDKACVKSLAVANQATTPSDGDHTATMRVDYVLGGACSAGELEPLTPVQLQQEGGDRLKSDRLPLKPSLRLPQATSVTPSSSMPNA